MGVRWPRSGGARKAGARLPQAPQRPLDDADDAGPAVHTMQAHGAAQLPFGRFLFVLFVGVAAGWLLYSNTGAAGGDASASPLRGGAAAAAAAAGGPSAEAPEQRLPYSTGAPGAAGAPAAAASPLVPVPSAAATPALTAEACAPRFLRYEASALEAEWGALLATPPAADAGKPIATRLFCPDVVTPAFRERFQAWVTVDVASNAQRGAAEQDGHAAALAARPDVFSRMVYEVAAGCPGAEAGALELVVHVSPLAGLLRDPRGPCQFASAPYMAAPLLPVLTGGGEMLQSRDTVTFDPKHYAAWSRALAPPAPGGRPRGRAILLDAGASTYGAPQDLPGEWPGTRWLIERYAALGVVFDEIYAWEVTPHPGDEFFAGMPPELVAVTHFYNFGISGEPGPASPLSVLKTAARPGDLVVFKLDVDNAPIENTLVQNMLADEEALSLITDFFFELHYAGPEMAGWWGGGVAGDLGTATQLFEGLRRKGVKAQFWP